VARRTVWILLSLSDGSVGTIRRSRANASLRDCVRALSRSLADGRDAVGDNGDVVTRSQSTSSQQSSWLYLPAARDTRRARLRQLLDDLLSPASCRLLVTSPGRTLLHLLLTNYAYEHVIVLVLYSSQTQVNDTSYSCQCLHGESKNKTFYSYS